MTEVFIDPSKSKIAIQVQSFSMHVVGFEITVFAFDGNTVVEQFIGDTSTTNPFKQALQKKPINYKQNYIRGTFTVISPDGKDYPYTIKFSILEEDVVVNPVIDLSGTTNNGKATSISVYHLN